MLFRWLRVIPFLAFTTVATTLLAFTLLEWVPGLATRLHLNDIRYYAMFEEYVPDRTLVFVPRESAHEYETDFSGDMSTPSFGATISTVRYAASYTGDGFIAQQLTSNQMRTRPCGGLHRMFSLSMWICCLNSRREPGRERFSITLLTPIGPAWADRRQPKASPGPSADSFPTPARERDQMSRSL